MADNAGRREHRTEILEVLSKRLIERPAERWLARLREFDIPCAPVQYLSSVLADPQVIARESLVRLDHPVYGLIPSVESPWRLGSSRRDHVPPPVLGVDSHDILTELGLGEQEITDLFSDGASFGSRRG
jgi:crotonobetainyl-CoA:carnitine CoA-transferase CaiB-like acyl-CoA transferase